MNEEETCNTTLGLGFGVGINKEKQVKENKWGFWLDLSLPFHPKIEATEHLDNDQKNDDENEGQNSFSSKTLDDCGEEEERKIIKRRLSNVDVYNNNDGSRKKLKLTTEQIRLLEDSFKIHSTLNTGQKQELAKKLSLLPRQIEVWFQNRRARTKLKHIEKECEFLKKCCETLNDENRRLKKELQEVRCSSPLKFDNHQPQPQAALPFFIRYPSTTVTPHHPCTKTGKPDKETKMVADVNGSSMGQMHDDDKNKEIVCVSKLM